MATPLPSLALPKFTRSNYGGFTATEDYVPGDANLFADAFQQINETRTAERAKKLEEQKKNATAAAKQEQDEITWMLNTVRTDQDLIDKNLSELGVNNKQPRGLVNGWITEKAKNEMMANRTSYSAQERVAYQKIADGYGQKLNQLQTLLPSVQKAGVLAADNFGKNINTINFQGGASTVGLTDRQARVTEAIIAQSTGIGHNMSETVFFDEKTNGMAVRMNSDELRLKYGPQGVVITASDYQSFSPKLVPLDDKEIGEDLATNSILKNGTLSTEYYRKENVTTENENGVTTTKEKVIYDNEKIAADTNLAVAPIAQARLVNGTAQMSYQATIIPSIGNKILNLDRAIYTIQDPELKKQLEEMNGKTYKEALPKLIQGGGNVGGNTYDDVSQLIYKQAFVEYAIQTYKLKKEDQADTKRTPTNTTATNGTEVPGEKRALEIRKKLRKLVKSQGTEWGPTAIVDPTKVAEFLNDYGINQVFTLQQLKDQKFKNADEEEINIEEEYGNDALFVIDDGEIKPIKAFTKNPTIKSLVEGYRSVLKETKASAADQKAWDTATADLYNVDPTKGEIFKTE
tara:strand:- start:76 stop:1797 length:1722 start_codon:yes stop_codon:yes gene_type:complete